MDAAYELSSDECKYVSIDVKQDYTAGIMIAVQAWIGLIWLIITMFVY